MLLKEGYIGRAVVSIETERAEQCCAGLSSGCYSVARGERKDDSCVLWMQVCAEIHKGAVLC